MSCKGQEMPTLGILGMTAHKIGKLAQTMYAEYDLNKSQSMILFQLHRDGRISQKELAQKLNVSAPSITSMIQKMEKSGYIVRNVDEKDQRMMRLDLTEKGQACIEHVKAITRGIRNMRAEMNVPNNKRTKVYIISSDSKLLTALEALKESVKPLMRANDIILHYEKKDVADDAVSIVVPGATVYLPLEDLVDFEQERERLKKEEERLNSEIKRAQGMLANERFTSKAPADKVQAERDKLEKYTKMLEQVKERIDSLR